MRRRDGRRRQQIQRVLPQAELAAAGGEDAVGARDRPGRADATEPRSERLILERRFIAASMKRGPNPRTISTKPGRVIVASRTFGIDSGSRMYFTRGAQAGDSGLPAMLSERT
jgi:hypothetical protein